MKKFLIVGTGFGGAVLASELAKTNFCEIDIIDERAHVAGNCYTELDKKTGITEHVYGPHIFNTDNIVVWNYINQYCTMLPYTNRVKAVTDKGVFSLPINLLTINQFFNKTFNPEEATAFIASLALKPDKEPDNFEEQAYSMIGKDLYENFMKGYTVKQWGCSPTELPASILKRLPVRFNYDDNYYHSKYQGIPKEGYTSIVEKILNHAAISIKLSTALQDVDTRNYDHVFYSGALDAYFNFSKGKLGYRTIYFKKEYYDVADKQGNPVINYCDPSFPYTRIHEHKHFDCTNQSEKTFLIKEFSKETEEGDIPYYPKRLAKDLNIFESYRALVAETNNITFIGRLGTYRYLDMHHVINESLLLAKSVIAVNFESSKIPKFSNDI